jgi:hypothetical protein
MMSSSAYARQDIEGVRIKLWRSRNVMLMNRSSANPPSRAGLGRMVNAVPTLILRNSQACLGS